MSVKSGIELRSHVRYLPEPWPASGRVCIVSHTLPPANNGQANVLGRLLVGLSHRDCFLLTPRAPDPSQLSPDLRGAYLELPRECRTPIPPRPEFLRMLSEMSDLLPRGFSRAGAIRRMAKNHGARSIVCCTGEVFELVACAYAARSLRLPLYVHMFDWYAKKFSYMPGLQGRIVSAFASAVEPGILRMASGVIVTNRLMGQELRSRYGIDATVIQNPAGAVPEASAEPAAVFPKHPPNVAIGIAGALYQAHYGAVANLLAAVRHLAPLGIDLIVLTDARVETLAAAGLRGPFTLRPRVSPEEVGAVLREFDILFVPLAFDSPFPEVVRTSLPSKVADYLASGTPILAHVPADTYLASYLRDHDCGLVVDRDDPQALAVGLRRLIDDSDLRRRLAGNALSRSRLDCDPLRAREAYQGLLFPDRPAGASTMPSSSGSSRVSVVIPAWNSARYVGQAVDSVLAQDCEDLEIIIVDDGSTDDLRAAIGTHDSRVTVVRQENRGPAAARNAGVALAQGEYIAFLDADDLFLPGKLRRQVQVMAANPDVVMSHTSYLRVDPRGDPMGRVGSGKTSGWVYSDLVRTCQIATPTVMVRRAALRTPLFDERLRIAEDGVAWMSLARTSRILGIDEALSSVRIDGRNASLDPRSLAIGIETVLREVLWPDELLGPIHKRRLAAEKLGQLAVLYWRGGRRTKAGAALIRAIAAWPSPLPWLRGRLGLRPRLRKLVRRSLRGVAFDD